MPLQLLPSRLSLILAPEPTTPTPYTSNAPIRSLLSRSVPTNLSIPPTPRPSSPPDWVWGLQVPCSSTNIEIGSPESSRCVVEIFGARATYLRIRDSSERKYSLSLPATRTLCHNPSADDESFLTLSHYRELSEFEACMIHTNDAELVLVPSIASTKIKRIIIKYSPAFELGH